MKLIAGIIVGTALVLVLVACPKSGAKGGRNTGAAGLPMSGLRSVDIDQDCTVDYEQVNLSKHKGHSLQWTTSGDFEIKFDKPEGTPCVDNPGSHNQKPTFRAQNGHNSEKCYPDPNATEYKPYRYSIYKQGATTACKDPAVIVEDGH